MFITPPPTERRTDGEIILKNVVELEKPLMTIWRSYAFYASYLLRLQTHVQNMQFLLIFHCNNGCTNASQCYVIRRLPVLLYYKCGHTLSQNVFTFMCPETYFLPICV
jgi:hypothetical protein